MLDIHSTPIPALDALVAEARAQAQATAKLLRKLDPFHDDPRVAHVTDICTALEGMQLFREDTLVALDVMAVDLLERLASAEATGRHLPRAQELRHLPDALVETASAARKLDDLANA